MDFMCISTHTQPYSECLVSIYVQLHLGIHVSMSLIYIIHSSKKINKTHALHDNEDIAGFIDHAVR